MKDLLVTKNTPQEMMEWATNCSSSSELIDLGKRLLPYCQPRNPSLRPLTSHQLQTLQDNEIGNDNDTDADTDANVDWESVRDGALESASVPLTSPLESDEMETAILSRMRIATSLVAKRCTSEDMANEYSYAGDHANVDDDDEWDMHMPEDEEEKESGDYGYESMETQTLSDLSLLPRARRALCFQVLQSALTGIQTDVTKAAGVGAGVAANTAVRIQKFASFCSSCLLGETDPRCLMQLLSLLYSSLATLSPVLLNNQMSSSSSSVEFPITELFDAIAPYYPVRFTPPPNDIHGITRLGIHTALFQLFTWHTKHDPQQDSVPESNMTTLATRLVLDRLAPPSALDPYGQDEEEDGAEEIPTVQDQLEALDDLTHLLLLPLVQDMDEKDDTTSNTTTIRDIHPALSNLTPTVLTEMRTIVSYCQNDSASKANPATSPSQEESQQYQALTNQCRTFCTRLAHDLEVYQTRSSLPHSKTFWNLWVRHPLETLGNTIATSPQSFKGRMATAHVASLAACGGILTLRTCLDSIVPLFLQTVQENQQQQHQSTNKRDSEQLVAALYGLGVLFSSCRLSMELIAKDGIHVTPHPLASFASTVLSSLCVVLGDVHRAGTDAGTGMDDTTSSSTMDVEVSSTLELLQNVECNVKIAAVKALESVLQCTPVSILNPTDIHQVRTIVFVLSKVLILHDHDSSEEGNWSEWKQACSRIVGSTIGRTLTYNKDEDTNMEEDSMDRLFFESDDQVVSFAQDTLFPTILLSSLRPVSNEMLERYDWATLSYACEVGYYQVSEIIVSKLIQALLESAHMSNDTKDSLSIAKVLSHVIKEGGIQPGIAFHKLQLISGSNILNLLILPLDATKKESQDSKYHTPLSNRPVLEAGMSALLLPEIMESFRAEIAAVVSEICSLVRSVFSFSLVFSYYCESGFYLYLKFNDPFNKIESTSSILSQLLPAYQRPIPMENQSRIIAFTGQVLPPLTDWDNAKLSVILPLLSTVLSSNKINSKSDTTSLELMCPYLVDYSLDKDNDSSSRCAASSCVFSIVSNYDFDKKDCLGMSLSKNNVCSPLSAQIVDDNHKIVISADVIQDSLNLLALLVCNCLNFSNVLLVGSRGN